MTYPIQTCFACGKCGKPTLAENGRPIGTVWVYQQIGETLRLAKDIIPMKDGGGPLYHYHDGCQP